MSTAGRDRPRADHAARAGLTPGRLLRLLRLPFLSVTLVGCAIGIGAASASGAAVSVPVALATIAFACLVHAGANVLNDHYDARNGSDAANLDRIAPFTGGSRLIQNGEIGTAAVGRIGAALLLAALPIGLWLAARDPWPLLPIGIAGVAIAWLYSAPPVALMCRGLGEPAIAVAWALVVAGAAVVQDARVWPATLPLATAFGLLVANVLFVNTFPDRAADTLAGKRTLVVRLGPSRAWRLYPWIAGIAHALTVVAVVAGVLPLAGLLALASAPLAWRAAHSLAGDGAHPARLAPAIKATIGTALVHGTLVATALFSVR